MRLQELIDALTELVEDDPSLANAPVMFAHQPRWPLQCGIVGPTVVRDEDESEDPLEGPEPVVYLAEGSWSRYEGRERSPYAPQAAWGDE